MRRRLILPLVALTLAASLTLGATATATADAPHRFKLALPSPGHVTVAELAVRATSSRPLRLPRRVWLGLPGAAHLPPSVKVLIATRAIRIRGGFRYAAAVFVVRKAGATAVAAGRHVADDDDDHGPNIFDLMFGGPIGPWNVCKHCRDEQPQGFMKGDLCDSCDIANTTRLMMQAEARKDADTQTPRKLSTLNDLFRRDFSKDGDPEPVFGTPDRPFDPKLDTGHYDDGHSFGWGTGRRLALPPADVIRVEIDLVEDIIERQPAQLIPDLEVATAVDLNGDGVVGIRQQIDTRVGPIVIS